MLKNRRLGQSDLYVSSIALGLWPIAGMTSLGVSDSSSIATILAALESGINHIDTAYSYGIDGRSDRILRTALNGDYSRVVLASKVGMYYLPDGTRQQDSRPETLTKHCEEILQRLGCQQLDLLYLHCVDGTTPIEASAAALAELVRAGKVRHVGVSNVGPADVERFSSVIKPCAVQLPLNMLQQETYQSFVPYLEKHEVSYVAYWALMKGLLAGKMRRSHRFNPGDRRLTYEIYTGAAWENAQDLLDKLRQIASESGWQVSQLVLAWTASQPFVGSVLCGAKTAEQIRETAATISSPPTPEVLARVEAALADHTKASKTEPSSASE